MLTKSLRNEVNVESPTTITPAAHAVLYTVDTLTKYGKSTRYTASIFGDLSGSSVPTTVGTEFTLAFETSNDNTHWLVLDTPVIDGDAHVLATDYSGIQHSVANVKQRYLRAVVKTIGKGAAKPVTAVVVQGYLENTPANIGA